MFKNYKKITNRKQFYIIKHYNILYEFIKCKKIFYKYLELLIT